MADLSKTLLAGEKVLWQGRPAAGLLFTPMDFLLVPFSVVWTAMAMFAFWESRSEDMHPVGLLFTGVFVVIGLFIFFGRFLVDAHIRKQIDYAVTDQRILIARGGISRKFTALYLDRISDVDLSVKGTGRGTIRFGAPVGIWSNPNGAWMASLSPQSQFLNIDDAQTVFDLIQKAMRKPS